MVTLDISIIIPVYNAQGFIEETVNSVLQQTLLPKEIILINDGSRDKSWDVLLKLSSEQKIVKIVNQSNSGPAVTRNRGVELAKNDWICFVDADDLLHPQRLEVAAVFSQNFDAVICDQEYFEDSKIINPKKINISNVKNLSTLETYISIIKNGAGLPSTLMKKSVFQEAGGVDPELVNNEDFEFHLRMIVKRFALTKIEQSLYFYRQYNSETRLSQQKNANIYIYSALEKMIGQIHLLPKDLQELSRKTFGNRIANNALKQALIGDSSYKEYILKAKKLNPNLKPYKKYLHNVISSFFGYGNLEMMLSKMSRSKA